MRFLFFIVSFLLCTFVACAQVPEDSPPYPQTGPGHAQLAVLNAGASDFMLHSAVAICYYDPTKPWVRTDFEMALMAFLSLRAFYPQFQTEPRSDNQLLRQRLEHSPAMQTALYHLLEDFGPQLQQFDVKAQDIAHIKEELLGQGAKKQQQYTNIPLGDAAYEDVRFLRRVGLAPLHSGERDFAVKQVMSRHEFAIVVARIVQAGTPEIRQRSSQDAHNTQNWLLPLNSSRVQSTPEIKAAVSRLLIRFTPELVDLGYAPEHLFAVQKELLAGDNLGAFKVGATSAFNDVPSRHWAFNAVEHLRLNGILLGDATR